jgi:hypothetical protein
MATVEALRDLKTGLLVRLHIRLIVGILRVEENSTASPTCLGVTLYTS